MVVRGWNKTLYEEVEIMDNLCKDCWFFMGDDYWHDTGLCELDYSMADTNDPACSRFKPFTKFEEDES